jgi:ribosomal protein S18 acetylase RimI-like enzyme
LIICSDIELATAADAAEISRLSRRCIERGLRPRYSPALVRKKMRGKACNVIVARKERVLLGFGIMTYGRESANLDLLAVKKPYRRRGVGRQILQWLEKVARTAGIANIFVQVRSSNAVAVRFYERLGFQVVEQVPGYYQGRESAAILCKSIQPMAGLVRDTGLEAGGQTIFR